MQLHISPEYADILWTSYQDIAKEFDTVIITDTAMYARAFLQNMDKHTLNIIIYITNRFDWGLFDTHDYDRPGSYNYIRKSRGIPVSDFAQTIGMTSIIPGYIIYNFIMEILFG